MSGPKAPKATRAAPPLATAELGQRLVNFGRALQDEKATLKELSQLALGVGMTLHIGIAFDEDKTESGEGD